MPKDGRRLETLSRFSYCLRRGPDGPGNLHFLIYYSNSHKIDSTKDVSVPAKMRLGPLTMRYPQNPVRGIKALWNIFLLPRRSDGSGFPRFLYLNFLPLLSLLNPVFKVCTGSSAGTFSTNNIDFLIRRRYVL